MAFLSTTIATFYQGISGRTIMSSTQIQETCSKVVDDVIDRMHDLCAEGRPQDAIALYDEIRDWVIQKDNIDVISLEYLDDLS